MDEKIKNIPVKDVQAHEILGFGYKKEEERLESGEDVYGIDDAWCYVGIERHSKMVLAWQLGKRDPETTYNLLASCVVPLEIGASN